jgi:V/A-type H+/Na+-transporting ATPase subunit D
MAENVKATRAELIKLKARIKLAKSGHKLLKKKRDGLIMEFFQLLKQSKTIRKELDDAYRNAYGKVNIARVLEGDLRVRSVALAVRENPSVQVASKNIIGVQVPRITARTAKTEREFFNSIAITEAAHGYELLLDKIILAAELETSIRKLLVEIEKTKRRVNALEFEVIPRLDRMKAQITLRLDEMERENFYRLKMSKAKINAQ